MMSTDDTPPVGLRGWFAADDCSLADFRRIVAVTTDRADYPWADDVSAGVLIYGDRVIGTSGAERLEIQAELARALRLGPGVVIFRNAVRPEAVDRATRAFFALIEQQHAAGVSSGDH